MELTNDSYESYEDYIAYNNITTPIRDFPAHDEIRKVSVADWVAIIHYILVVALGVPGNGLVVWITTFEMKRSVNTIWFQNLAVADLLCCLSVPFSIMNIVLGHWPLGLFGCKFIPSILILNMYASIFLLTMISIDRCALVMKPVWCQNNRSPRKAYVACAVVWILAIILTLPALIFRNTYKHNEKEKCVLDYRMLRHYRQLVEDSIALCRLLIGFVIPFLVIISCYTVLMHRVKLRFTRNAKTIRVAVVVITVFFVCWLPYHVASAIIAMNAVSAPLYQSTVKFLEIFVALAFLNSCINPIIYVLMGQEFKGKFKRSLKVILRSVLEEGVTPSADSNSTNLTPEAKNTETSL